LHRRQIGYTAVMVAAPAYKLIEAAEFLEMDFGTDKKAELEEGHIRMMSGGTISHALVQANLMRFLGAKLRGSGCRPYGSDMALQTGRYGVRYPDVSVICNHRQPLRDRAFAQASVVFEVLSDSTSEKDQTVKLREYQGLSDMQTIVFIDPDAETVRVVQRESATAWHDEFFATPVDVALPSLNLSIPATELFATD
jgi:Uma2 family endonuclease